MFSGTIYFETPEGKVEKLSMSFSRAEDRNVWITHQINELDFIYCILHNDSNIVRSA